MRKPFIIPLALFVMAQSAAGAPESDLPLPIRSVLNLRQIPDDTLSVHVIDLDSGETVLGWNDDVARNPASTMKLVTTLVALDVLGPSYRWQTDVYALGDIVDGRLDGDLLLQGHGDPYLVTERVWKMLRIINQAGIREVSGDLLLDDSYFDVGPHNPAEFDHQPLRAYNVAPNALLMNFKVVRYWFEPDLVANMCSVRQPFSGAGCCSVSGARSVRTLSPLGRRWPRRGTRRRTK